MAYVSTIERGGPITHLQTLVPSVQAHGADVLVVCNSESVAARFGEHVRTEVAPIRSKWDVLGARRIAAAVERCDIVHLHDRRAILTVPVLRGRARSVWTYHGLREELAPLVGRPPAERHQVPSGRRLLREAELRVEAALTRRCSLIAPSAAMAEFLAPRGFRRQQMTVLPYGIVVPPRPERPHPSSVLRVGTSAILIPRKGIDVLIDACGRARTPLTLDVFGDGPCRADLEAHAQRLGVEATFHGMVSDVPSRLGGLDVFVLPTRGDNLPVAVLEAMAAGLPVVATRTGGLPELVVDGQTGALVEPGDVAALAAALDRLGADPEDRRRFGEAGRERVTLHFEAADVARRMLDHYEWLCASSTSSRS